MRLEPTERHAILAAPHGVPLLEDAAQAARSHASDLNDIAVDLRTIARLARYMSPRVKCHFNDIVILAKNENKGMLKKWQYQHYAELRSALQQLRWTDSETLTPDPHSEATIALLTQLTQNV